ncbi:MAG: hypothetical protein Edafosvirus65_2 [Edafosvirus sp.]|uniref:Uncharacterized protein n=1 Tax=Edafosvirus sp. TaxID=2487765 RepID=A0A3G4ZVR1_9VIRU|nr:MAG: hypothetical protein Edafosvirus65_2 [Edafosvirus sp.]
MYSTNPLFELIVLFIAGKINCVLTNLISFDFLIGGIIVAGVIGGTVVILRRNTTEFRCKCFRTIRTTLSIIQR